MVPDSSTNDRLLNEFFLLACVGIVVFCLCWLLVSLVVAPALSPAVPGLATPIEIGEAPAGAGGVLVAGWGRFLLIVLLTLVAAAVGLPIYARTLRPRLVARGWVLERSALQRGPERGRER